MCKNLMFPLTLLFQVSQLSSLMGQLPEFNKEVEGVMASLGQLEATCQEVEIALLALEDTIDAREAQERQLESRFQLALDQERRRQELEELEQRLEQVYQSKVREKEKQKRVRKEKCRKDFRPNSNRTWRALGCQDLFLTDLKYQGVWIMRSPWSL